MEWTGRMATRKEILITDSDLSDARMYTDVAPSTYDWYLASRRAIWLNKSDPVEVQRLALGNYKCDWDFTYKTVLHTEFSNKWPYSYKVLSSAAMEQLTK